ncbi:hypothetical protein SH668x_001504 [Planctomicrobium sp. SH668]|uniref:hypothetical protein n=1 Tax=Planctomicrobium sp. SH668 TaxID=3448126 RepID=UPI003F5BFE58
MSFLHALQHNSVCSEDPFLHWMIDQPFNEQIVKEVAFTDVPKIVRQYDGTRAGDMGGGEVKTRCYIDQQNVNSFPGIAGLIDELMSRETIDLVGEMLRRPIDGYLRVEVISDREGFWLAPHKDIKEKLMSMLLYVNPYNESENLGTDFYDMDLKLVKTMPYRNNFGYMFAPSHDTWHGLEKKAIRQERRSMLINYVTFETEWKLPSRKAHRRAA